MDKIENNTQLGDQLEEINFPPEQDSQDDCQEFQGKKQSLRSLKEKRGIGLAVLFFSPFVMYGVFEWLTGNLMKIHGAPLFWNLFLFALIYLTVFGVTRSMRIGYTVLNGIFTIWALAEYFVVSFRSRPILLWDIMAFRTAATVAGNYQYDITKRMAAGVLFILLWTILIWIFPVKIKSKKRWALAAAGSVICFSCGLVGFYRIAIPKSGLSINMWEPRGSIETQGYLASTFCSVIYLKTDPPTGYSIQAVEDLQAQIEEMKEEAFLPFASDSEVTPTNIICIMNESFSDLRKIAPFETDVPFLSYYDSISENCVKGDLYMPVFGSMTCNSEFEFLTGNSMAFMPDGSVPFQVYMRDPSYSIVSILKDEGYRAVAMHPNLKSNWNREGAYKALGFDEFYGIESFDVENGPYVRGLIGDQGDYEKIISLTEAKEEGEPLFIFDVTMQNHSGYSEPWEATVHLTEYDDMPMTEQYLSLIRESDKALQFLLEYYSQVEEPTMIVLFGDHQPAVEEEFFEALYGSSLEDTPHQDMIRRHITPFMIWTNYSTESMMDVKMSAQFLTPAALERANIQLTDYFYFLNHMYQETPVVHFYGYMREDGKLISWDGWRDGPDYLMYRDFWILQYNNVFEKKRNDLIFRNAS